MKLISLAFLITHILINHASATDIRIDKALQEQIHQLQTNEHLEIISGAVIVNAKRYQYHAGRLSNGTFPNSKTLFEIGSITKTYTGLLLAKAVIDKKIKIDDPVKNYLPAGQFPSLEKNGVAVTFRHLATHTSGLPKDLDYSTEDAKNGLIIERLQHYSPKKFMRDLAHVTLVDTPGKQYLYSNAGALLVSYVLERIYQNKYGDMLQQTIFSNSGEKNTRLRKGKEDSRQIVRGTGTDGKPAALLYLYSDAEGGLTSDTESILNYASYLLTADALEVKESKEFLMGNRKGNGRTYFWNTFNFDSDEKLLYHGGGSLGTSSWISIYPDKGVAIFLVTNSTKGDMQGKLNEAANRLYQQIQKVTDVHQVQIP